MIETERLILRKYRRSDAKILHNHHAGEKRYYRYTRIPYPYTRKCADEFVKRVLRGYRNKESFHLMAILKKDRSFAGSIGLNQIRWDDLKAEMGYSIVRKHSGRGLVTEAARAFIDYVFNSMGLHRLEINCVKGNKASKRVIEKLGARFEGISRESAVIRDKFVDQHIHSILSKEWKQ